MSNKTKSKIKRKLQNAKRKIKRRLDKPVDTKGGKVFSATNIHYDVASRTKGVCYGGVGSIHSLVNKLGLADAIDERLHLLKFHFPYYESDHVLNIAYT